MILIKHKKKLVWFICLVFFVPLENFSLIWRHHYYQWKAANLTYARLLWPSSSEGSLECHTYYDTRHPFIMVISGDPWHLEHLQWSVTTCFHDLGLSRLGFEHPTFCLQGQRSNRLRHHRGQKLVWCWGPNWTLRYFMTG